MERNKMKKKYILGMRDIPTIQGLRNQSMPTTREQAVAEVARMEHEKARLQRELGIWLGNQEKTQNRLRQVEERLTRLQEMLDPPADTGPAHGQGRRSQAGPADDDEGEDKTHTWREISLEY
jgi:hypothetical protein